METEESKADKGAEEALARRKRLKEIEAELAEGEKQYGTGSAESKEQPEKGENIDKEADPRFAFHKVGKNGPYDIMDGEIEKHILKQLNIIVIAGKPYIYTNGVYKKDDEGKELMKYIRALIFPELVTIHRMNRVYKLLMVNKDISRTPEEVNRYPSDWINFKNGMLDVKTGIMHEHSPDYYSVNQIPHNYVEGLNIENTVFYKFLQSRIPDKDNQAMLFQFMGYCMTKDITFQKFMILYGLGESGKSTVINFLSAMVGQENTCSVPLQQLGDRFTTAVLLMKILNTCGDLTNAALTDTSVIKQLTGDDDVKGEYKGGAIFNFKNHAKMIFSCNELPKVLDEKSNGFYRRLLIIRFTESGEYIPDLKRKLADEREVEAVISGCISSLKTSLIEGRIFESRESIEEIAGLRYESDTVAAFLADYMEPKEKHELKRGDVYKHYESYCCFEGRTPLKKSTFFKSLQLKGYPIKKTKGEFYVMGLTLKILPDAETQL